MERVTELVGVYHASGTLWGELSYWVGARLGRAHCALCDVTHGTFRPKAGWSACAAGLGVPFTTFHLDDRPADVAAASVEGTPCVLARLTDRSVRVLVGPAELEACGGNPAALIDVIERNVTIAGLSLGGAADDPPDPVGGPAAPA